VLEYLQLTLPEFLGSIFKVLKIVLSRPPDLVSLLASSLPQQSVFFINYILVVGMPSLTA
jgi:hypothetical protein